MPNSPARCSTTSPASCASADWGSSAATITERLDRRDTAGDDARRHRLLVADLAEAVLALLADHPVLLRIEDLHWADELSLAVLGRLAPLIRRTSSMVIASYRSDEIMAGSALATWRVGLLQQRFAEEVSLPRLDRSGTLRLTEALLGTVPAAELVDSIHERSNGIPLHIEELVAAGDDHGVPDTVGEAVRARAARLDDVVREIMAAAAVIGCSFEFDLLTSRSSTSRKTRSIAPCACCPTSTSWSPSVRRSSTSGMRSSATRCTRRSRRFASGRFTPRSRARPSAPGSGAPISPSSSSSPACRARRMSTPSRRPGRLPDVGAP